MIHGAEPHVVINLGGAAQELDVVVGHRGSFGVTDDVHLAGAGCRNHPVDEPGQLLGALLHREEPAHLIQRKWQPRDGAVRQREDAVAVVRQQWSHDLPFGHVCQQAVDQHDRFGVGGARLAGPVVDAEGRGSRRQDPGRDA